MCREDLSLKGRMNQGVQIHKQKGNELGRSRDVNQSVDQRFQPERQNEPKGSNQQTKQVIN